MTLKEWPHGSEFNWLVETNQTTERRDIEEWCFKSFAGNSWRHARIHGPVRDIYGWFFKHKEDAIQFILTWT